MVRFTPFSLVAFLPDGEGGDVMVAMGYCSHHKKLFGWD